jgi:hypothetical protein
MKHRPAPVIAIPLPHDQQKKKNPTNASPKKIQKETKEKTPFVPHAT